ncbi:MAG: glycine cleavage system protein GcvH [Chloroflexi bacterium]|nr:glycine cleavage system protein GcvH [Chloroflexota bacterium]
MNPANCKYTKGHTWVRVEGNLAVIGLTDYAQQQLGKVLFVEAAAKGKKVAQSQSCGTVESDKATSDIMCPVTGEVTDVNEEALDAPELLNQEPYGKGWLIKVRLQDSKELGALMTAQEFEKYIEGAS